MCANKYAGTEVISNMTTVTFFPPIRSASTPKSNRQIEPFKIATEDSHAN